MRIIILGCLASVSNVALAQQVPQDQTPPNFEAGEIIVTAQKRSESVNSVGMSINAASGETLTKLGITQPSDLGKITPGFIFAQTQFATPVYSIRGVGFYETSLAATPAVTVYTDEVPLPYPQMTRFSGLDVERVEILKGPQGTLFGQNSTGGAINYIAAKPTKDLALGFDASFGRFNTLEASGFVSGPLNDTLSARIAVKTIQSSDWQKSYTRDDSRGKKNVLQGRILLEWQPSESWKSLLSVSGWRDHSDSPASQLAARTPSIPPLADPRFLSYPLAPDNARAADWTPGERTTRDDRLYQIALRNEFALSDALMLTSITAYTNIKIDSPVDADGTTLRLYQLRQVGETRSFSQELRLSGDFGNDGHWIVGANYARDKTNQDDYDIAPDSVVANLFGPGFSTGNYIFRTLDKARTLAAFGNLDLPLSETIKLQAGVRYTDLKRNFAGCTSSIPNDVPNGATPAFNFLINSFRSAIGLSPVTIAVGDCITFDPVTFTPQLARRVLEEDNLSWRVGLNWQATPDALLYANISKGYKAGTFASIGATLTTQYEPARQEALLAYETGFKLAFLDRRVQMNGALFYYDYKDKQLRGSVVDPFLGSLDKLVNVPKSHVAGGELQVTVVPVNGLRLTGGATYVFSKVDADFSNYTPYGTPANFKDERFPYTPRWQASGDAEYQFALNERMDAFLGASLQYQSATTTAFGRLPIFRIPSYALLDLRAGIATNDDRWRLTFWGRNVTDKFYFTSVSYAPTDATVRAVGMPVTYGVSLSYRL